MALIPRRSAIAALVLCLGFLAAGSSKAAQRQTPKPVRIVSLTLGTDEITAGLVDPSRIVGMSRYASDETTSNVSAIAKKVHQSVERDVEQIIALKPDIVLSARYSKLDGKEALAKLGIPYRELTQFGSVSDIEMNIRTIAADLGEETRGEAMIREMRSKLDSASQALHGKKRSWRALYLAPGEWTAGSTTLFDEIIRHAGLHNAAAETGFKGNGQMSLETILTIDPDLIVIGSGYSQDTDYSKHLANDSRLSMLQAVRNKRIISLPARHLLITSQFIGDAALDLSERVAALPE